MLILDKNGGDLVGRNFSLAFFTVVASGQIHPHF